LITLQTTFSTLTQFQSLLHGPEHVQSQFLLRPQVRLALPSISPHRPLAL
ncbi:uncharacterized protein LACBIDRAFT_294233, partial [Laccaria bicolor S238N-H82]